MTKKKKNEEEFLSEFERSGKEQYISLSDKSQIRVLSTKRIGKKLTKASDEELALIVDGLNEIIGG